jgi:hypothetical protein
MQIDGDSCCDELDFLADQTRLLIDSVNTLFIVPRDHDSVDGGTLRIPASGLTAFGCLHILIAGFGGGRQRVGEGQFVESRFEMQAMVFGGSI